MELSDRFSQLKSRVAELGANLLPIEFSPIGEYSDQQLDMARGYRLLVHAEMESYLEDIARTVVSAAVREWPQQGKHKTKVAFLASYHSGWSVSAEATDLEILEIARSRPKKDSINGVVDIAFKQFLKRVSDNHGIREKNLATLVMPTGIDIDELDPVWVTNLDSFGKLRGDIAHNSKSTTNLINPKDEFILIGELMEGLEVLDRKLLEIHRG